MLVCRTHGFGFVRVPKNASTSMAAWLIHNYASPTRDSYTDIKTAGIGSRNLPRGVWRGKLYHAPVSKLDDLGVDLTGIDHWYGIVREPFERQVSLYVFLGRKRGWPITPDGFRDRLASGIIEEDPYNWIRQIDYFRHTVGDEGSPSYPHRWISYPHLQFWREAMQLQHGLARVPVPDLKRSSRTGRAAASLVEQFYDTPTRAAVRRYFEEDLDLYADTLRRWTRDHGPA